MGKLVGFLGGDVNEFEGEELTVLQEFIMQQVIEGQHRQTRMATKIEKKKKKALKLEEEQALERQNNGGMLSVGDIKDEKKDKKKKKKKSASKDRKIKSGKIAKQKLDISMST